MSAIRVPVIEKIFSANDRMARLNYDRLQKDRVFSVNLMASPVPEKPVLFYKQSTVLKGFTGLGLLKATLPR